MSFWGMCTKKGGLLKMVNPEIYIGTSGCCLQKLKCLRGPIITQHGLYLNHKVEQGSRGG